MEGLNKENKMIFAEDFKTAKILEELVNKFTAEKLKSNLTQIQLDKSRLQLQLSISLILLGLGLVFLINRNYKKSRQISILKQIESENQLLKNEIEKIELTNHLKLTEEELNTSITTIKKIMLLKKQLENITNDKLEQSESEIRKQTKLILNTFFDNYRELYTLIYKKRNYDTILKDIKIKFPEINDREIEIINYILLKFTNKEIAILLDKSVKSIEYNRSQIRKKIGLNPEDSLEEYLELC